MIELVRRSYEHNAPLYQLSLSNPSTIQTSPIVTDERRLKLTHPGWAFPLSLGLQILELLTEFAQFNRRGETRLSSWSGSNPLTNHNKTSKAHI